MQAKADETNPYEWIEKWIVEEGTTPLFAILATVDHESKPYTRTIAIREINEQGVLFFTQKGSKKVQQLQDNPSTSLTLYLPIHKRQITFRGVAKPLSNKENTCYWETYPKESQLRFLVYGPKSGEKIVSNMDLDEELDRVRKDYQDHSPERPESYVGYRIEPIDLEFYQLNSNRLSDSFQVHREGNDWTVLRVVP